MALADVLEFLGKVAPTIASALGGPLAGLATAAIAKALGTTPEEATTIMQSGQFTSDQLAAIKLAEMEMKKHEEEYGFKFAELEIRDRDSARVREVAVKDGVNTVLAYSIVGGFIAMVGASLLGYAEVDSALAGTLVGYLSAKCEQVLSYYFGSTRGSDRKTELLAKSTPPAP